MRRLQVCVSALGPFLWVVCGLGQHRGDPLAFQGLEKHNEMAPRALAVGGAYYAHAGDLSCLFYNPAGLAALRKPSVSVTAESFTQRWWENQVYRPNRMFVTLPFYLQRLYIPDPANNGRWDYEIWIEERDSTYIVQEPKLGLDPFSEEAAQWKRSEHGLALNQISFAVPLPASRKPIVVSASFGTGNTVLDYDRNDTYLDPHIGYDGYGIVPRVSTDTLRIHWYEYARQREGKLWEGHTAVAYELSSKLLCGVRVLHLWGKTDDNWSLNKVGWFDLAKDNRMRFSYDTLRVTLHGTSEFSTTRWDVAILLRTARLGVGAVLSLPRAIRREWNYQQDSVSVRWSRRFQMGGVQELKIPLSYVLGLSLLPVDNLELSFGYGLTPYSRGSFSPALDDTLHDRWLDKQDITFGLAYSPRKWATLMAGYRRLGQVFSPDGNAFPDKAPAAEAFTTGLRLALPVGLLDLAWEWRWLRYYDSYYSNTNYATERLSHLLVGYTWSF